ncbi:MAG: Cytochrome c-554 [Nitrospira sp.]|nr:Cytochrome c-554 [Nitrospira sp.]
MRKIYLILVGIGLTAVLLVQAQDSQAPVSPNKAGDKGGGKAAGKGGGGGGKGIQAAAVSSYNLKVLTTENVEITMQNITLALGVGCTNCHELSDLSLDTKPPKVKARMMLEMVRDINAKFGDGKTHVTCWTCHRASTKPQLAKAPTN